MRTSTSRLLCLASLIVLAVAFVIPMTAQSILPQLKRERPDIEKIRREITDRSSPYYYPRLMEEYLRNDTAMKIDKYRRLYLGFMFQEDYNPYRPSISTGAVAENYTKEKLSGKECDDVIAAARRALDNNPFDLKQMMYMIQALRTKGDINLANIWQYKLNYILMAIVSTGTGLDEDNAWFVIEPQHEYVLLNMMGYTVKNHLFYGPYYECIKVVDPQGSDAGEFYFNIKTVLDEYYRKYPDGD